MELTADPEKEPYVKTQISELVSEENKKRSEMTEVSMDVNVNIKMIKKWKIKMYIFQDLFLSLCFHKGSFFF